MKPATIYDVAAAAGVSHQTVTRFLNGFEGIRPATRERVQKALTELDYRPNSAARFLRGQRTNRIGVLAHQLDQPGPARNIAGSTRAARDHGYVLDIVSVDAADTRSVAEALDILFEHQIAGVLVAAQSDEVRTAVEARSIAVPVAIDNGTDRVERRQLSEPGRLAAAHLADLGHRDVGYIAGPSSWIASRERERGFREVAAERGLTVRWSSRGDWTSASGWTAAFDAPVGDRGITAVAASNDSMAIGFIAGLHEQGVRVPDDVSVVGVDDAPDSRFYLPSLTTIRLDFEGEGARLMEDLIARIEERDADSGVGFLPAELVARKSTKVRAA
ncbi:LacI family DNA-binding transcriptional regulator [Microbacterium gorillae]|uniref:LacI family DNA-binding transcriptional regulator n=1 Tax=Microbacterium gorillae TaxID=1231063 RepID=UPI00058E0AD0|nr:LacI family DNA-binding transcriptional regulator [Microbacterium gorillae]